MTAYGFLDDEPDRSTYSAAQWWDEAQGRLGLREPMSAYVTDEAELLHTACLLLAGISVQLGQLLDRLQPQADQPASAR